jgi:hypothetical protein
MYLSNNDRCNYLRTCQAVAAGESFLALARLPKDDESVVLRACVNAVCFAGGRCVLENNLPFSPE